MRGLVAVAILLVAGAYVALGAQTPWDFQTYYYAASAFRAHLNPYSLGALSQAAGKSIELPFLYPPITLTLFVPFTFLPVTIAAGVWLGLKVLLLAPLVWIWKRYFLPTANLDLLLTTTLLGFNLALLWDLRTGNVAVLETLVLWLGFSCYVRGRTVLSACLIAVGSVFKLIPALLLGTVAIDSRSRLRWVAVLAGLFLLAASVTIPANLSVEWKRAMATASSAPRPTGDINPSALGTADWITTTLELPTSVGPLVALLLYFAYCAIVLIASLATVFRSKASGDRVEQVVIVVLLWLLVSPRVMVYSYVMAIVPVLYVIETRIRSRAGRMIAVLAVLGQGIVRLLPGPPPELLSPLSFLILLGAWALVLLPPLAGSPGRAPIDG